MRALGEDNRPACDEKRAGDSHGEVRPVVTDLHSRNHQQEREGVEGVVSARVEGRGIHVIQNGKGADEIVGYAESGILAESAHEGRIEGRAVEGHQRGNDQRYHEDDEQVSPLLLKGQAGGEQPRQEETQNGEKPAEHDELGKRLKREEAGQLKGQRKGEYPQTRQGETQQGEMEEEYFRGRCLAEKEIQTQEHSAAQGRLQGQVEQDHAESSVRNQRGDLGIAHEGVLGDVDVEQYCEVHQQNELGGRSSSDEEPFSNLTGHGLYSTMERLKYQYEKNL